MTKDHKRHTKAVHTGSERTYKNHKFAFVFSSDINKWIRGSSKIVNRYED